VLLDETEEADEPWGRTEDPLLDVGFNSARDKAEVFPPPVEGVAGWDLHSHPAMKPTPTAISKRVTERLISIKAFWQ
jgi:hypothetical protein